MTLGYLDVAALTSGLGLFQRTLLLNEHSLGRLCVEQLLLIMLTVPQLLVFNTQTERLVA